MSMRIDDLPGYRRRIRIEPRAGAVLAMLEDDMHCMAVTLHHAGGIVTAVEPRMERAPWTTCPGARATLVETFAGQPLAAVTARRAKRANCTHLHDLACFAAAHAGDARGLVYDILVSDPRDGECLLELRRDHETLLCWRTHGGLLAEPDEAAGLALPDLREWIKTLPAALREPARALQWAGMVAHGRALSIAEMQAMAPTMPPSCHTFQPERRGIAVHSGDVRDFSDGSAAPLDRTSDAELARLHQSTLRAHR
jgi:hypothetical protein